MVSKADSNNDQDAFANGRRNRFSAIRRQKGRGSKIAQVASIAGLALSIGTALYRFRRQWIPKVEGMSGDLRGRMSRYKN